MPPRSCPPTTSAERAAEGGATPEAADAAPDAAELEEATAAQAPAESVPVENGSDVETDLDAAAPPADDGSLEQLDTPAELAIFASDAIDAPGRASCPRERP